MSFGFGIGDFIAVSQLARTMHTKYIPAMRNAPQEFRILVDEVGRLHLLTGILVDKLNEDPESLLTPPERKQTLESIVGRVQATLGELEKSVKKFDGYFQRAAKKRNFRLKIC